MSNARVLVGAVAVSLFLHAGVVWRGPAPGVRKPAPTPTAVAVDPPRALEALVIGRRLPRAQLQCGASQPVGDPAVAQRPDPVRPSRSRRALE